MRGRVGRHTWDNRFLAVSFGIQIPANERRKADMLWTIFVAFLFLWFLGFSLHVGVILLYLLLVVALTVLIINLRGGHRSAG
jgi:phosphatidylglycerophosphate synthase